MNTAPINGFLETEILNKIATITFGHPAGNSFPSALLTSLTSEITALGQDDKTVVIVLKSQGDGVFCGGASFDELLQIATLDQGTAFFSQFANVINAIRKCVKPVICRVQGKAVGGGVGLIAACDYAMATKNAAVKLSELAIGIGPFVIAPAVARKIGATALAEMCWAPHEWKDAQWSNQNGLFAQVFDSIETLDDAVLLFSQKLASYNPEAVTAMKKILWQETDHWDNLLYERAQISGKLVLSDFTKNALIAFKK